MFISTTQVNIKAVKLDCNCDNAVPAQGNQEPTAKDFTAVLKVILSDLNKTGLLKNQNGQPVDINELTNGLLSDVSYEGVNIGEDKSLADVLQQIMAQLQMIGMAQPVIVNVIPNDQPSSCMTGNSEMSMVAAGNASIPRIKPGKAEPGLFPEIKPEVQAGAGTEIETDVEIAVKGNSEIPLAQSKDVQNNNGVSANGLKNTDLLPQSKNGQKSDSRNTTEFKNIVNNLSNNIAANADKGKLEDAAPDFNNNLTARIENAVGNNEQESLNGLKVTGIETESGVKEPNNPVPATAHSHHAEYGKNSTIAAKETVHISRLSELSEPIAKNVGSGNSNMTIKLTPPELGNVQIKLRMENGVLKADFIVDSHSVKDLFSGAIPQIKIALEDSGIKSGDFLVNVKKEGYYSDARDQQPGAENFNKQQQRQQRKSGSQFYDFFA